MNLSIENLTKSFDEKTILKNINFKFEEGKIYGLLGRNGAGKTTLFNCINRDIDFESGNIYIENENGKNNPLSSDIGYVLSTPTVPEFLTGREFLKFFLDVNKDNITKLENLNDYFDIIKMNEDDSNKLMKDYSHGMKNKLQMLVNIVANPKVLLLDEPLTSFDVVVADDMKKILRQIKNNRIIIFSTHIMELALDLCDEIVILNNSTLELIDKNNLDNEELKDKIISILKGDENA